jgi:hypothetical protein
VKLVPNPHLQSITGFQPVSAGGRVHHVLACTARGVTMDLNYLLSRHQISLMRARASQCVASRASHRAFAAGYAERIRELQLAFGTQTSAIAV